MESVTLNLEQKRIRIIIVAGVLSYWGYILGLDNVSKSPLFIHRYSFCILSSILLLAGFLYDVLLRQALIPLVKYVDIIEDYFRNNKKDCSKLVGWQQYKNIYIKNRPCFLQRSQMDKNKVLYMFWVILLIINGVVQFFFLTQGQAN
jgi:hypothetical protein